MSETIAKYVPNQNVVDLITWVDPKKSGGVFGGITVAYYFLEWSGYTFFSLLSNTLMFLIIVTTLWSNVATIVGRSQPPIPVIEITESDARVMGEKLVSVFNKSFAFIYNVLTGSDLKLSIKCTGGLFLASKVGGICHFLTMIYLVAFVGFVFPKIYILKQKNIDNLASVCLTRLKTYYNTLENAVLSKNHSGQKTKAT